MSQYSVLITGAGKGIGRAVVHELVKHAALFPNLELILLARTESDLIQVSNEVFEAAKKHSIHIHHLAVDLALHPTTPLEWLEKNNISLQAVIHSAGVGRFGDFLNLTPDDLHHVTQTNITASFLFLQKAYETLKKNPNFPKTIQVVTSVAAIRPFKQSAIYCMSKYAQKGLLEVMRLYGYEDQIRIQEILPGATETPMWGELPPEIIQKMMSAQSVAQAMVQALALPNGTSIEQLVVRPTTGDLP